MDYPFSFFSVSKDKCTKLGKILLDLDFTNVSVHFKSEYSMDIWSNVKWYYVRADKPVDTKHNPDYWRKKVALTYLIQYGDK